MATIAEALVIAVQHHQAGRLHLAEQVYRQILKAEPNQPDAIHLLGVLAHQLGKDELAVEHIAQAIRLKENDPAFHINLGEAYAALGKFADAVASYHRARDLNPGDAQVLNSLAIAFHRVGQLDEAVACYRQVLKLQPDAAETHRNLGAALARLGKLSEAVASYRRALNLKPDLADAHYNLAIALHELGQLDEAVNGYRRALELNPASAESHNNLGNVLRDQGKLQEAIASYRRALELKPDSLPACNNLAIALMDQGKVSEAVTCYQRALELNPHSAEAHANLGNALAHQWKLDEAIACYQKALTLNPNYPEAHNNLGMMLKDQGKLDAAIACLQRALELKPDFVPAHSNLIYTRLFSPDQDPRSLLEEPRRWNELYAAPLVASVAPHSNDPSPDRRLRVGYVSPSFRNHPVGRFLLPLLEAHDRANFEIFAYASVGLPDEITVRSRNSVDGWRDALRLTDEQLAQTIREDRIDVLVDLTMHMSEHRLLAFARKPAPVQVTYLAYCGTTGLATMDYRLTDPYLDPPDQEEGLYSEQSVRLPQTYWCYRPAVETPAATPLPALRAGYVTFGSLNNFCKVTAPTLCAWVDLLRALPTARLVLHAYPGSHRDEVQRLFARRGVSPERLSFVEFLPTPEYFRVYERIDVLLDPFPYGGGTTSCDAIWMGVPVVSLAGQTALGRAGLSILSNLGLPELVARDPDQYVKIAAELAGNLPRLSELRATLRTRLQGSPLMNAPRFARNVEGAYRMMWHRWCVDHGGKDRRQRRL